MSHPSSPVKPARSLFPSSSQLILFKANQNLKVVWIFLLILISTIAFSIPVSAHKVEVAEDVGGTLHLEPHDTPQAGIPSQAWIALTHKGGKAIALSECNCQLAIYATPHPPGTPALLQPTLKPVSAERYQNIPGAEITFPQPGAYQLQLTGKPVDGKSFHPFNLKFDLTVAQGAPVATTSSNRAPVNPTPNQINQAPVNSTPTPIQRVESQQQQANESTPLPFFVAGFLATTAVIGSVFVVLQRRKKRG